MSDNASKVPAATVYTIEEFRLSKVKYWGSALLSFVVAVATLGAGASPIVRSGYRIRRVSTGETVGQVADSVTSAADTGAMLAKDLAEMTAGSFAAQWL